MTLELKNSNDLSYLYYLDCRLNLLITIIINRFSKLNINKTNFAKSSYNYLFIFIKLLPLLFVIKTIIQLFLKLNRNQFWYSFLLFL